MFWQALLAKSSEIMLKMQHTSKVVKLNSVKEGIRTQNNIQFKIYLNYVITIVYLAHSVQSSAQDWYIHPIWRKFGK